MGWHVQIHMRGEQIVERRPAAAAAPPLVFDHLGALPLPEGTAHPAFKIVRGLVDKGRPGSSCRAPT